MQGYVRNKTPFWRHAMKRSVAPGSRITLDSLYEQYGEKHSLDEGEQFVSWLRDVKLKDSTIWEIVYNSSTNDEVIGEVVTENVKNEINNEVNYTVPFVKKELTSTEIADFTVKKAHEVFFYTTCAKKGE